MSSERLLTILHSLALRVSNTVHSKLANSEVGLHNWAFKFSGLLFSSPTPSIPAASASFFFIPCCVFLNLYHFSKIPPFPSSKCTIHDLFPSPWSKGTSSLPLCFHFIPFPSISHFCSWHISESPIFSTLVNCLNKGPEKLENVLEY